MRQRGHCAPGDRFGKRRLNEKAAFVFKGRSSVRPVTERIEPTNSTLYFAAITARR
jgi:molybdopterin-guanine dinucleotide biosynthesis protein A